MGNFSFFRKEVKNETSDINFIYEETFNLCIKLLDTIGTYKIREQDFATGKIVAMTYSCLLYTSDAADE